jgi:hypothetical protein
MTGEGEEKETEKNCHMLITSPLNEGAVIKTHRRDLERAVRVIIGKRYTNYKNGLKHLNLSTLDDRRESSCLKFAQNCRKMRNE